MFVYVEVLVRWVVFGLDEWDDKGRIVFYNVVMNGYR